MRNPLHRIAVSLVALGLGLAACGGDGDDDAVVDTAAGSVAGSVSASSPASPAGVTLVSPTAAAATIADPPADLVVLDVRTPEEYAAGHVDGAAQLDFYEPEFADDLAGLDRDVPYVVYCQSGNRSGQTVAMMEELGFTSVQDVDGGIIAWQDAGLPVTTGG